VETVIFLAQAPRPSISHQEETEGLKSRRFVAASPERHGMNAKRGALD
jgi:hypothetical protein